MFLSKKKSKGSPLQDFLLFDRNGHSSPEKPFWGDFPSTHSHSCDSSLPWPLSRRAFFPFYLSLTHWGGGRFGTSGGENIERPLFWPFLPFYVNVGEVGARIPHPLNSLDETHCGVWQIQMLYPASTSSLKSWYWLSDDKSRWSLQAWPAPGGHFRALLLHLRLRRVPVEQLGDARVAKGGGSGGAAVVAAIHLSLWTVWDICHSVLPLSFPPMDLLMAQFFNSIFFMVRKLNFLLRALIHVWCAFPQIDGRSYG